MEGRAAADRGRVGVRGARARLLPAPPPGERQLCERSFRGFVELLARRRKLIEKALTLHSRALERRLLTKWRLVVVYGLRMRKLVLARALRRFARRTGYQGKVRTELDALKVLVYRWQSQSVLLAWNRWHASATSRAKLRRTARHLGDALPEG